MIVTTQEATSIKAQLRSVGVAHIRREKFCLETEPGSEVLERCLPYAKEVGGIVSQITHCVGHEHLLDGTHITIKAITMGQNGTDG